MANKFFHLPQQLCIKEEVKIFSIAVQSITVSYFRDKYIFICTELFPCMLALHFNFPNGPYSDAHMSIMHLGSSGIARLCAHTLFQHNDGHHCCVFQNEEHPN